MVQAPVRALDPDGVAVVSAGTIAFAIAAVTFWLVRADLEAVGRLWYLGVSVTGTVLGLLGLAFGLFRKSRRYRLEAAGLAEEPESGEGLPKRASGESLPERETRPRRSLDD